ncbi:MAG TPA: hypothetical protein VEU53_10810, partial [Stellaceae bacterium]|nr:hypothetical protein [Stellaceae bacterium]
MSIFGRIRESLTMARPALSVAAGGRPLRGWHDARFLVRVRWRALLRGLERRHLRSNEIALTLFGAVIGAAIGIGVVVVRQLSQWLHEMLFKVPPGHLLSEGVGLAWWRVLVVPCVGGLVVGIVTLLIRRFRPRE